MQSDLKMDQTYIHKITLSNEKEVLSFFLSCKQILSSKICGLEQHPGETSSL